jgi:clan AA aspartic protease
MGTFSIPAGLANIHRPEQRLTVELLVDTCATWTMLPDELVKQLGLTATRQRAVTLANGQRVVYEAGQVAIQLNGEEMITLYLAGPPGCLALLGAVTLEEFGLAPDPVSKTLVPVAGLLAGTPAKAANCENR